LFWGHFPAPSPGGASFPDKSLHHVAMSRKIPRRTKIAGKIQKKPLLASHIRRLFGFWRYSTEATLFDLMRLTAICVSYASFLCYFDLMAVRWEEIMFFPTHMELF
jgi:hypothetical protein